MVAETKLDNSFPKEQFYMKGYAEPLRLDRDGEGGGLLVYVKKGGIQTFLHNPVLTSHIHI